MNRIVHLALKVDDLEKTTAFYRKVFGLREVETRKTLCLSPREVR
jgi:catechol 2,3-dioxygenase-like lactoylglutathione lyase family enzyme